MGCPSWRTREIGIEHIFDLFVKHVSGRDSDQSRSSGLDDFGAWPPTGLTKLKYKPFEGYTGMSASGSHLDLDRAPYVLYGVKYIDPVSLVPVSGRIKAKP